MFLIMDLVGVFDLPRRHFRLGGASASSVFISVPKFPIFDQSQYEDYTPAYLHTRLSHYSAILSGCLHTELGGTLP